MALEYGKQTVAKLQLQLVERGASTRGKKQDLIERFEAYDRNNNFAKDSIVLPAPTIVSWPTSGFKQLHAEHHKLIPRLYPSVAEGYFLYQQVCAGEGARDLKALEKGEKLLQARFLWKLLRQRKNLLNTACYQDCNYSMKNIIANTL